MSRPPNSTSSVFSFAWSAIHAGHTAGASGVSVETRSELQRNELVLSSDIQEKEGVTAEDWKSFWGRDSKETWQDETLGAGNETSVNILVQGSIRSVRGGVLPRMKGCTV